MGASWIEEALSFKNSHAWSYSHRKRDSQKPHPSTDQKIHYRWQWFSNPLGLWLKLFPDRWRNWLTQVKSNDGKSSWAKSWWCWRGIHKFIGWELHQWLITLLEWPLRFGHSHWYLKSNGVDSIREMWRSNPLHFDSAIWPHRISPNRLEGTISSWIEGVHGEPRRLKIESAIQRAWDLCLRLWSIQFDDYEQHSFWW